TRSAIREGLFVGDIGVCHLGGKAEVGAGIAVVPAATRVSTWHAQMRAPQRRSRLERRLQPILAALQDGGCVPFLRTEYLLFVMRKNAPEIGGVPDDCSGAGPMENREAFETDA